MGASNWDCVRLSHVTGDHCVGEVLYMDLMGLIFQIEQYIEDDKNGGCTEWRKRIGDL